MSEPFVFIGMPGYGELTAGASRGFWRATRLPDARVYREYREGSLLAANFNGLWCGALNLARTRRVDYFAMIHADIEPEDWWLDALIAELEATGLDVLGAAVPIKDAKGLTSLALARPDGDTWRPLARLTMSEVHRLPATFTSEDVGHPLLLNTGLWVCRFDPAWARKVRFTINDRIVQSPDGTYMAQCEPEDWYFSRLLHELGLKVGATRKVKLTHRGPAAFSNAHAWGQPFDSAWVGASPLPDVDRDGFRFPHDVDGWLTPDEGKALWRLAAGKRILEVGSYCGKSTLCLAQSAGHVYAFDPGDGRGTPAARETLPELRGNVLRFDLADRVTVLAMPFDRDAAALLADPVDLAFIDGAHDAESVRSDIDAALSVLAPDGLIAFHDYRHAPGDVDGRWDAGVTQAVAELIARGGELLQLTDTLAVVRPPAETPSLLEV